MAGILLGIVLLFSVELCITTVYKVEPLNATDKNVFYDQESNRCHIMGIILLEKTEAETVRPCFVSNKLCRLGMYFPKE